MFPSFSSLSDREHKRQDLLERTRIRVQQANKKRQMYEEAIWASDADKIGKVGASGTNSEGTQVSDADISNAASAPNAKILIAKKIPSDSANIDSDNAHIEPDLDSSMISVKSLMNDMLGQIDETMSTPSLASSMSSIVPASLNLSSSQGERFDNSVVSMISAGEPMETGDTVSDIEAELEDKRAIPMETDDNEFERDYVIRLFKENEKDMKSKDKGVERISLPNLRLNPVMNDHGKTFINYDYVIGKNGEVLTDSGGKPKNIEKVNKQINWILTSDRLIASLDAERHYRRKMTKNAFRDLKNKQIARYNDRIDQFIVDTNSKPNTTPPSQQIQKIYKHHPELVDRHISPWINDHDENLSFKRDDIYFGKNGELHYSNSGEKVLKNDLKIVNPEIDWDDTLELVESELDPSRPSKVNIVTSAHDIQAFIENGKSKINAREMNQKAKADFATILRNNHGIIGAIPYTKNNDPLVDYTISLSGDRLSLKNKRTGHVNPILDKSISWTNTLKNMLEKINKDKKKTTLDLKGTTIPKIGTVDSSKRALGESAVHPPTQKKLQGRGLRGAGKLKGIWPDSSEPHINNNSDKSRPYKTIDRKGKKYYNLHDIQGTGLQSAFTYKPLGSKYIRIPDLYDNKLNIVYPSRARVGPKREISKHLADMIKDLVYDGKISQQAYDMLPVEDQRLFKEILAATHLQLAFRERLADPIETLKAEFHKLKGEFLLGNNNPDIIKQLKALTVDMFANKLISEKEFKDIILSII